MEINWILQTSNENRELIRIDSADTLKIGQ